MKTGNTQSPSGQSATTPGGTGRLGKSIVAGLMAALILAVFLAPSFQAPPTAEAQVMNNAATGQPGIVDAANPNAITLTTVRPGMTLQAVTTDIMDDDGLTNPNWTYQWAHWDGTTRTDITGATAITYLLKETDIGNSISVSVTFTDDRSNPEGPLRSPQTHFVGPQNLIVSNTGNDAVYNVNLALTATTPKLAQSFTADTKADTFTLDFIELSFGNIGDTATIADGITVTLNADSSGDPGGALCTLGNPTSFSSSGAHKFYAPHSGISTLCPLLVASTSYHVVVEKDSSYTSGVNITHYQLKGTNKESAFDWSIPDEAQHYTSSAWADNATEFPMLIDVRARPTFELAELTETEVLYGWSLIPEGVTGGQKFRLMFLTEGDKPTSTDIDIYNQFVQGQAAAGHADVQEHANQFRVLASTADDEARDNTETTSSDTDAPIYWLNGAKVADNYADLYDGTWDEEVNRRTPTGDPSTASHFVWTGSDDDGTGREETSVSVALGETSVRQGEMDNSSTTRNPLSASTVTGATNTAPFYALSGIFVVEPNNEATGTLSAKTSGARVNDVVYINGRNTIRDPEGLMNARYALQWKRYDPVTDTETDIEDATDEPYTVRTADAEHQLRFSLSFTDDQNNPEVLLSEYTPPVVPSDVLVRIEYGHDLVDSPLDSTNASYGQKFNTGSSADGYTVDAVGFHFAQIDAPATAAQHLHVTLEKDDGGTPAGALCRLQAPASFSAPGMNYFTSPTGAFPCPTLDRNTDYHVVIHRAVTTADVIAISTTTEDDEANGSEKNWTLDNTGQLYTQSAWTDIPASRVAVIEIKGTESREITIPVDSPVIPEGLEGNRFRLMFISGETAATERNLFLYNQDLQDLINDGHEDPGVGELGDTGTGHLAVLASTEDVDARDNTYTTYTATDKGVPIFWYNGAIVADDYEDLYDGTWQNEDKPRSYDGTLVTDLTEVYWTGSDSDGTAKTTGGVSKALAQTEVETGILDDGTGDPLSHAAGDPTEFKSMYAMTGTYVIEDHEAIGLPAITGVPRVGETLTADTSSVTDGNGMDRAKFVYQWNKIDGDSTIPITGATSKTYTPTADVVGKRIALGVTITDNHGYKTPFLSTQIDPTEPIQPTDLIVKNTELGTLIALNASSNSRQAQGFTAASDAEPYSLTEVRIRFAAVDDPAAASTEITLTINAETSGFPGEELCTLSNPSRITGSGLSTFEVPDSCPPLTPRNTYYVVIARGSDASGDIEVNLTGTPGQHEGSAPGWTLDFPLDVFNNGTWVQSVFTNNIVLDIRGEIPTEVPVPENWSLTPSGLIGGEKFRLMFITGTGTRKANSTEIEDYNAYVQSQAKASNAHTDIKDYAYHFRVLGSTADVDARDNTKTNPNDYTSVPIYWMGGTKVADNYGDFYDGTWDDETNPTTRSGSSSSRNEAFTGTGDSGSKSSKPLGSSNSVTLGRLNSSSGDPLDGNIEGPSNSHAKPYYALSNIFVVPNSDATGQPAITGTPRVNHTLSVDTLGITDAEGTSNAAFTYQWIRVDDGDETDINGATRSTYEPNDQDADKQIKVKVSFTDDEGFDEGPLSSEPTIRIVGADVLVRNTGQTLTSSGEIISVQAGTHAQQFTTGPAADGYALHSIGFRFFSITDTSVASSQLILALNENTNGSPGNALCRLIDPSGFTSSGLQTFTVPTTDTNPCPTLVADTSYFAVITRGYVDTSAMSLNTTTSTDEDPHNAAGWSIGNDNRYFVSGSWFSRSSEPYLIEVKGVPAVPQIITDHRAWVDNRQGSTDTGYDNTGDYIIAQGFRTGDTAGVYEVHEIHVDFDSGQPATDTITVKIVESTAPDDEWEHATPFHFERGGEYPALPVPSGGVLSFTRSEGNSALKANTNYFLIVESTSEDPANAAIVQMTENEGQTSDDGWTVENYSQTKTKEANATWTKQEHQLRFRISGEYRDGIGMPGDSYGFESCVEVRRGESASCVLAVAVPAPADPDNPPENVSKSSLVLDLTIFTDIAEWWTGWWEKTPQTISFPVTMRPLPTGSDYVILHYNTRGQTAVSGHDYWNAQGTVRFDSSSHHTQIVKVQVLDDGIEDSGETFGFSIYRCLDDGGDSCEDQFTDDSGVDGIIYNTEESAEVSYLKVSDVTVIEAEDTVATFTVSLSAPTTAAVYFDYTTEDGTAVDGTDYTGGSGTAFLANGDTSVTISVPVSNDDVWTGDRNFTLNISEAVHAAISDASGTATIKDDEAQALTARFTNLPEGNHGEKSFSFNISFNQDVSTKYLVMQNDAMTVTNGEVTHAERIDSNRDFWRITVDPDSGADVTVLLPTTESCSDTGAICTRGDSTTPLTNSVSHTFPGTQLNAKLEGVDSYHDGSTAFKFNVVFSEEVDTTATEIGDHALTITGGTFTKVVQKDDDSTRSWEVTVKPSGIDYIEVSITRATDCANDGHICTSEGELLSNSVTEYSTGPELISVSDATVQEADGAELVFTVSFDEFWFGLDITVDYTTSDGTATVDDYTPTSGTLTFRRHKSLTISVPVLTDTLTEDTETITLTLSNPVNVVIADGEGTGTIQDAEPVAATPPDSQPTGLPIITGAFRADDPLTADTSAIIDANGLDEVSYSYQWIMSTNGTDADLSGATASTYTPNNEQVGNTFKVRVSFTDDNGYAHTLTSEATTPLAQPTDPIVWSADMLIVEYSSISIGAASADLFTNIGGTRSLSIQSIWSYVPDQDLRLAFNEALDDADDLTLIVGDLQLEFPTGSSGNGSFKWNDLDLDWQDGDTIAVSIVPTSTLTETTVPNTAAAGQPTIIGTPQVGQVLTADTSLITDADGLLSVSYLYQWLADDVNISGATRQSYTLTENDLAKTIKVTVSFNDDRTNPETLTSAATLPVAARPNTAAGGSPSIQGILQDQQQLTADTAGITDADGLTNATLAYQWMRVDDGSPSDIAGQTGSTYTLTASDVGQSIQLKVTFTDDRGFSESLSSAVTDPVTDSSSTRKLFWLATIVPNEDGQIADYTYNASTDDVNLSPAAFTADQSSVQTITYLGASQDNATKFAIDLSSQLTDQQTATWSLHILDVELDFRNAAYSATSTSPPAHRYQWDVTEYATDTASLPQNGDPLTVSIQEAINLSATGQPTIGGTPQVGDSLNADASAITDGNGLSNASYQYQWTAGGSNIDGATASSLLLTSSQEGDTIQVIVTFDDDDGFSETATSEATTAVAAGTVVNSPPNGLPTISGTPEIDQTLTANTSAISDGDGLSNVSYAYQWLGDGSAISGATGSTLLLTSTQLAQTIQVRVTFDDDAGNTESLTSAATVAVTAKPVPLTASLTSVPATHNGSAKFTFELTFSENVKAGYERIRDEAFTIVGGDIKNAKRREQGTNQYWTITVKPDGNASVYITLPATTDCDATSAICTYDGRMLSGTTSDTITRAQ